MRIVALTGNGGGKMAALLRADDVHICVPHKTHRAHPGSPPAGAALPVRRHRLRSCSERRDEDRVLRLAAGAAARRLRCRAWSAPAPRPGYRVEDRRTTGTQIDDEGIELRASSRISERFGESPRQRHPYNRGVLLTGEVPDAAHARRDREAGRGVPNVRARHQRAAGRRPPRSQLAHQRHRVTTKVKTRFLDAKQVQCAARQGGDRGGVVYLLGMVTEEEANEAVEIARTTGGVRKVVKMFELLQGERRACACAAAEGIEDGAGP